MAAFGYEAVEASRGNGHFLSAGDLNGVESFGYCPLPYALREECHAQKSRSAYCELGAMPRTVSASSGRKDGLDFIRWNQDFATG